MKSRGALLVTLLLAAGGADAADARWAIHQDETCGIELKYPPAYALETSGPREFCAARIRIGVKEPKRLRALLSLEILETRGGERADPAGPRRPATAQEFALDVATTRCAADGPDGSTYCTNGMVRSTFKTAQGFHGFEIYLTEVRETVDPKKVERRSRGPVVALDLSDDETVRVLLADVESSRVTDLRMILDTLRVWTKPRRQAPRVTEMPTPHTAPHAFAVRIVAGALPGGGRVPPVPVTSWLLTDPRGRRLGRDPVTGAWYAETPAVTHSTTAESGFVLREPLEGRYELQVTASRPSVHYQIAVQAPDGAGRPPPPHLPSRVAGGDRDACDQPSARTWVTAGARRAPGPSRRQDI